MRSCSPSILKTTSSGFNDPVCAREITVLEVPKSRPKTYCIERSSELLAGNFAPLNYDSRRTRSIPGYRLIEHNHDIAVVDDRYRNPFLRVLSGIPNELRFNRSDGCGAQYGLDSDKNSFRGLVDAFPQNNRFDYFLLIVPRFDDFLDPLHQQTRRERTPHIGISGHLSCDALTRRSAQLFACRRVDPRVRVAQQKDGRDRQDYKQEKQQEGGDRAVHKLEDDAGNADDDVGDGGPDRKQVPASQEIKRRENGGGACQAPHNTAQWSDHQVCPEGRPGGDCDEPDDSLEDHRRVRVANVQQDRQVWAEGNQQQAAGRARGSSDRKRVV